MKAGIRTTEHSCFLKGGRQGLKNIWDLIRASNVILWHLDILCLMENHWGHLGRDVTWSDFVFEIFLEGVLNHRIKNNNIQIYFLKFWFKFDNFLPAPMLAFYFKAMNYLCFLLIIIFDLIYIVILVLIFPLSWAYFPPTILKSYVALAFSSLYWPSLVILPVVTLNKYLTSIAWTLVLPQNTTQS